MDNSKKNRREFIIKLAKVLGVASGTLVSPQLLAKSSKQSVANLLSVKEMTVSGNRQRLVFDFDSRVKHAVFSLDKPDRVVLDLKDTRLDTRIKKNLTKKKLVSGIRHAMRNQNDLRIVFDLADKAKAKSNLRKTKRGYQLELTLTQTESSKQSKKSSTKKSRKKTASRNSEIAKTNSRKKRGQSFVVAIDPGHGGKDPGAVGRNGTREKDVVLKIAKRLQRRVNKQKGMKAVLTRDGDYYVSLRKRMNKARANGADLFISIHADANPNRKLTGSSVYILSENGASSEASRWLAKSENSYEHKLGNTVVEPGNKVLSSLLLDLSQSATIDNSLGLAQNVLKELSAVNRLLRRRVESAAFVVLKSPDIPSMLVETAFISNPKEEKRLNTTSYQNKLANAMFHGIRRYHLAQQKKSSKFA